MPPQRDFVLLGLLVLSLASVLLTSNLILTTWNVHRGGSHRHLSYHIGSTGPGRGLQVPGERRIKMLLHEDARYNWSIPSTAKAVSEKNFPRGSGSFRSPVDERAVFISMYHQLHCVETMGQELVSTRRSHWGHLQHCMNFLRELTLCRPDLTLEPGDFTKRDFAVERTGAVHTCRDADQLRSIAESDWRRWMTFWQDHPELNKTKQAYEESRTAGMGKPAPYSI